MRRTALAQFRVALLAPPGATLAAAGVVATLHGDPRPTPGQVQESRTRLVLLGTGTPNAEPARSGPAVAVVVDDTPYLVDFGPGVVRRAAAAFEKGVTGLEVKRLRTAFATHLHSDHTPGYPDLIFTPAVLERAFMPRASV